MADTFTPTLNLCRPEIDASSETWGQKLNADLDLLDQFAGTMNTFKNGNDARITALINAVLPYGVIIAWVGAVNAVPAGWHLCDGTNGTPNLSDRFILGNTGTRALYETGGAFSTTASTDAKGVHQHTGVVTLTAIDVSQMPSHQHGGSTNAVGDHTHTYSAFLGGGGGSVGTGATPAQQASPETSGAGNHAHGIVTDFRGGNQGHTHGVYWDGDHVHSVPVSIVPPYVSLCYIMKVS